MKFRHEHPKKAAVKTKKDETVDENEKSTHTQRERHSSRGQNSGQLPVTVPLTVNSVVVLASPA